jgi:hypothetical protein
LHEHGTDLLAWLDAIPVLRYDECDGGPLPQITRDSAVVMELDWDNHDSATIEHLASDVIVAADVVCAAFTVLTMTMV